MRRFVLKNDSTWVVVSKYVTLFLFVLFASCLFPVSSEAQEVRQVLSDNIIKGDANNDGKINMTDVSLIINIILGKDVGEFDLERVDVNNDGYINMADVTAIINIILGNPIDNPEEEDDLPPVEDDDAIPDLPVLSPKHQQ